MFRWRSFPLYFNTHIKYLQIFLASTDCFSDKYTDFSHYHLATLQHMHGTYASPFRGLSEDSQTPFCCKSATGEECTTSCESPQRKKLHGIMSQDLAGLSTAPRQIIYSLKATSKYSQMISALGGGGVTHFNCLNTNTTAPDTVLHDHMFPTNIY